MNKSCHSEMYVLVSCLYQCIIHSYVSWISLFLNVWYSFNIYNNLLLSNDLPCDHVHNENAFYEENNLDRGSGKHDTIWQFQAKNQRVTLISPPPPPTESSLNLVGALGLVTALWQIVWCGIMLAGTLNVRILWMAIFTTQLLGQ